MSKTSGRYEWESLEDSDNYPLKARKMVLETLRENHPDIQHPLKDVYVVWFCYILGGWKALVGYHNDGLYYEVTHDKIKGLTYVDVYAKQFQRVVKG